MGCELVLQTLRVPAKAEPCRRQHCLSKQTMTTGTKLHRDLGFGGLLVGHALHYCFKVSALGCRCSRVRMLDALGCCQVIMQVRQTETEGMQGSSKLSPTAKGPRAVKQYWQSDFVMWHGRPCGEGLALSVPNMGSHVPHIIRVCSRQQNRCCGKQEGRCTPLEHRASSAGNPCRASITCLW